MRPFSGIKRRSAAAVTGAVLTSAVLVASMAVASANQPASRDHNRRPQRCTPSLATGPQTVTVHFDGVGYPVRVHLPTRRSAGARAPMVMNLHYSNGNADDQATMTGMEDVADEHGFIAVEPNGALPAADPNPNKIWFWNVPGVPTVAGDYPPADARDDIDFLTTVIDTVTKLACADSHRVYLTGHSGGARMASAYACARPDKIAAIAPNSGLRAGRPSPDDPQAAELQTCQPSLPVPVVTFHGDADDTNPYQGNSDPRWGYPVQNAVQSWALLNGCRVGPVIKPYSEHVSIESYTHCRAHAAVRLYKVSGGTHSWPGSEGATQEINASETMWDFFTHYRR